MSHALCEAQTSDGQYCARRARFTAVFPDGTIWDVCGTHANPLSLSGRAKVKRFPLESK